MASTLLFSKKKNLRKPTLVIVKTVQAAKQKLTGNELLYGIEDNPPWYMAIFLGLQHYLTMLGATLSIPFLLCPALCIEPTDPARGSIISTLFFVSGIATLLQSTFGCR
jgi:nucleobase transporter 1/2